MYDQYQLASTNNGLSDVIIKAVKTSYLLQPIIRYVKLSFKQFS